MSWNALIWKWSSEYDTGAKRKKLKIKFSDITTGFAETGTHPAIGNLDTTDLVRNIESLFSNEKSTFPFALEKYENCVVINYGSDVRIRLITAVGSLANSMGLNCVEF